MSLTGKQRAHLRGLAHALDPVLQVGKDGVTPAVVTALTRALFDHELVKVKVLEAAPSPRKESAAELAAATGAENVGEIGRIVMLYKRHPETPRIVLPKSAR